MATINAINSGNPIEVSKGGTGAATLTGVLIGNGTSAVSASTVTQYGTVVAGASNAVSSIAPSATSGIPYISQGAAANPTFGTAVVAGGGTGATSFTAYSVVCAGTTGTGAMQNVSGLGSAGQVLTSNGAAALPTWQAAGGGVTSATGTANQISVSAATGAVTWSLPAAITAPGSLTTTTTLTATLGDITATAGNVVTTLGDMYIGNTAVATTSPILQFKKSRTGGVITSGDLTGTIKFSGIGTGSTYTDAASITVTTSGTIAANRVAGSMAFATHPDSTSGGNNATTRMTIGPTGKVTFAAPSTTTDPNIEITPASGNIALSINGQRWLTESTSTNNAFGGGITCGTVNASGSYNTALGYQPLTSITSGNYNTCLGAFAGIFLTTGTTNTLIGAIRTTSTGSPYGPGGNYTGAESHNICINTAGTTGESNVLRIGNGTGTGTAQLAKAFISGITGKTPGVAGPSVVVVDTSDQLGTDAAAINLGTAATAKTITIGTTTTTSSLALNYGTGDFTLASATGTTISALDTGEITMPLQPAFLAYLATSDLNVTGDGTIVTVGSITALTEIFDQNSDFNTNGTFTAPVTGKYLLKASVQVSGVTNAMTDSDLTIATSNRSYVVSDFDAAALTVGSGHLTMSGGVLADMDAADTCTFTIELTGGTKVADLVGTASPYVTFMSGYLAC